jgi:hypothetical protein
MGALDLNLLSVRRLVELLSKVIVLRFEIIIITKEALACFVAVSYGASEMVMFLHGEVALSSVSFSSAS